MSHLQPTQRGQLAWWVCTSRKYLERTHAIAHTHTHTYTKAAGWNPTQKLAARRLCQPQRRPAGGPLSFFSPSRDPRRSIRNLVPGGRFKSRWRPEAVLAAEEVLLGDTMLSKCVLVARRDVFDVRGGMVQAKRSVLIGITLKSGLGVYRQHWGSKRPILLISSAGALNVKARLGTCGEVEGCFACPSSSGIVELKKKKKKGKDKIQSCCFLMQKCTALQCLCTASSVLPNPYLHLTSPSSVTSIKPCCSEGGGKKLNKII